MAGRLIRKKGTFENKFFFYTLHIDRHRYEGYNIDNHQYEKEKNGT